jgi:hypothetical protein
MMELWLFRRINNYYVILFTETVFLRIYFVSLHKVGIIK